MHVNCDGRIHGVDVVQVHRVIKRDIKLQMQNNMVKLVLHWEYFKSTLVLNLATSVLFAFVIMYFLKSMPGQVPSYPIIYIRCLMVGGPLLCFLYKEISRKNEYYFYYNRGISKLSLWIVTLLIYIVSGTLLINILQYAKLA